MIQNHTKLPANMILDENQHIKFFSKIDSTLRNDIEVKQI